MPAELKLTYSDGSSETIRLPVEIWNLGNRFTFTPSANGKTVVAAELDPRHVFPDLDRRNNTWRSAR